jgi:hypothetical protein
VKYNSGYIKKIIDGVEKYYIIINDAEVEISKAEYDSLHRRHSVICSDLLGLEFANSANRLLVDALPKWMPACDDNSAELAILRRENELLKQFLNIQTKGGNSFFTFGKPPAPSTGLFGKCKPAGFTRAT